MVDNGQCQTPPSSFCLAEKPPKITVPQLEGQAVQARDHAPENSWHAFHLVTNDATRGSRDQGSSVVPLSHGQQPRSFVEAPPRIEFDERNVVEIDRDQAEQQDPTAKCGPVLQHHRRRQTRKLRRVRHPGQGAQFPVDSGEAAGVRPHLSDWRAERACDLELVDG